jgi:Family of unknown function (DUF6270)
MKVFVLGSCVSRDIVEYAPRDEFEIVEHLARSSLASIFARQPFEDAFSHRLTSKFQARSMNMDVTKVGREQLATLDADLILMDLIDERFDLVQAENPWCLCTASHEFIHTGAHAEIPNIRFVKNGSDRFIQYWKEGWDALVRLLSSRHILHKVRVNKVFWQRSMSNGEPFAKKSPQQIEEANTLLDKLYVHMSINLAQQQFFEYDDAAMVCPADHQWDPAPFHYSDALYRDALEKVRRSASRD